PTAGLPWRRPRAAGPPPPRRPRRGDSRTREWPGETLTSLTRYGESKARATSGTYDSSRHPPTTEMQVDTQSLTRCGYCRKYSRASQLFNNASRGGDLREQAKSAGSQALPFGVSAPCGVLGIAGARADRHIEPHRQRRRRVDEDTRDRRGGDGNVAVS